MPRPGPRPYECVRRAWHSERHQPMRGLIIQQIFRLVHDNHPAATKQNREWQEKLPIVVFKAEEIMYSKANSEAEYSNSETLWDRVNDAVDTIIRKDESMETGNLLPPCVEAALNLGCVPIRASRSQRHNNPRTYLRPAFQECGDVSQKFLNDNAIEHDSNLMPFHTSKDSMLRPPNVDSPSLIWEYNKRVAPHTNQLVSSSCEKLGSIGYKNNIAVENNTSLNRAAIYPLYYGSSFEPKDSPWRLQEPLKPDPIIVGVPIFSPAAETVEGGCLQNLLPCGEDLAKETRKENSKENQGKQSHTGFDLSLRLGLFSNSSSSREKAYICGTDGVGQEVSQEKGQSREEFSLFPMESAYGHSWLHKSRWNSESEIQNADVVSRKRKLPFNADVENDQVFWSQDSTSNHFAEK